jgi:hypothetical protein
MGIAKFPASVLIIFGTALLCVWLAGTVSVGHCGFATSANFLFMAAFSITFSALLTPAFLLDISHPDRLSETGLSTGGLE